MLRNGSVSESISYVTTRRNAKVASVRHLAVPFGAHLSRGGLIEWQWSSQPVLTPTGTRRTTLHQNRKVSAHLWRDFAVLADAGDERIVAFAARWGPLREDDAGAIPRSERLHRWRSFSVLARALLRCSVALKQAELGDAEDWQAICNWLNISVVPELIRPTRRRQNDTLLLARFFLVQALNAWYAHSRGNSLVGLFQDKIVIAPTATTLFGIIGTQLAYQITGADQMFLCYHCSRFFSPQRKPSTGMRNFCGACRRSAKPQMYAMRDHRTRMKGRQVSESLQ
jgi:hypothetical protein